MRTKRTWRELQEETEPKLKHLCREFGSHANFQLQVLHNGDEDARDLVDNPADARQKHMAHRHNGDRCVYVCVCVCVRGKGAGA